ncbi:MAG: DUF255 domain-containing protein [Bacteroidota bacterium]
MKRGIFFTCLILSVFFSVQLQGQETINWLSVSEIEEKLKQEPRKILVKIYQEDCVWCKRMDEETFNKSFIADYINEHFYAVALDAQSTEEILFNEKTYKFIKNGKRGHHELAAELTKGNLSYPSVVFLDEKLEVLQSVSGYKNHKLFQQIMAYYGKNYHKKVPWSSFRNNMFPE